MRDFGRGIPLGKIVECVSRINTGAKYNDDVFQFSVGLNGVGTKAVNALSSSFTVASFREGTVRAGEFRARRVAPTQKRGLRQGSGEKNGTLIEFSPDPTIFKKSEFKEEHVTRRLRMYTYLNAGLKIRYNGTLYHSKNGLLDLLDEDTDNQQDALYPPLHHRDRTLEIALTHTQRFSETHYSFVNGQYTSDGGTHLSAFREGVLKAVNDFTKKKYEGDDVREGLVGAVAIRLKEPIFESQTKNKLGNTEIRGELVKKVQDIISDLLHRNPEAAEKISAKVEDTARLRRELASVKKLARERSAATTLRIPQLKDCKLHLNQKKGNGGGSMVFLTEGQSAAGSLVSCRDVMTQAIFVLKGKPLNVNDLKRAALYKNDELYNLMRALNVEESVDGLRYEKGDPRHRRRRGRAAHPQLAHHVFPAVFPGTRHARARLHFGDAAVPRAQQEEDGVLLRRTRTCIGDPVDSQSRNHALQGPGRDQPDGVQGICRARHAPEPGGGGKPARDAAHPGFLHGQEHSRTPHLHHGQAGGRSGGSVARRGGVNPGLGVFTVGLDGQRFSG